jgi:hypothetical protein
LENYYILNLWNSLEIASQCFKIVDREIFMEAFVSKTHYIFRRCRYYRSHSKSTFDVEVLPGISAKFGEPKSKFRSSQYHLIQLSIDRNLYSEEISEAFWKRFNVVYINSRKQGKRLPQIYRVIGSPNRLIHHGYIAICEPSLMEREVFSKQNSYEYWSNQFYVNSNIYSDVRNQKEAIALLINKIGTKPAILRDIPTKTGWRVFEEIVAEVFRGFGYQVDLTKMTRDGGKDIIALRKHGDEIIERLLIECKHWKDKLDVRPVRNLVGVAVTQEELPTGIILATTSSFTEDAKELQINPNISIKLDLRDYNDILSWIGDYNAIQLTPQEIEKYLQQW